MITISRDHQKAVLQNGELISYSVNGYEFIHQKGSPGWGHSDIEMFPVIGPTANASHRVQVPRGNAIQDQHGMLRDMDYQLDGQNAHSASFIKSYSPRNVIRNSKYPDRSTVQWLVWPYSFEFRKVVTLTGDGLEIQFRIAGERDMPFMLGYHPAFKLRATQPAVKAGKKSVTLQEVLAVGSRALLLKDTQELNLQDERQLTIRSRGFRHFMLWTEVANMICIEPITFYPYDVEEHALHQGFDYLTDTESTYSLLLLPEGL